MTNFIQETGGIFAILMFVHLLADWMTQTDSMARRKTEESPWMLAVHSAAYAAAYIPILSLLFDQTSMIVSVVLTLFMSHGAIDTYAPVWLWARFIRRPPEMKESPYAGFVTWRLKPRGMVLIFGVDHLMHAAFLVPIAAKAVMADKGSQYARVVGLSTFGLAVGLAILSVATILWLWKAPKQTEDWEDDETRPAMPSQHDE